MIAENPKLINPRLVTIEYQQTPACAFLHNHPTKTTLFSTLLKYSQSPAKPQGLPGNYRNRKEAEIHEACHS